MLLLYIYYIIYHWMCFALDVLPRAVFFICVYNPSCYWK